MVVVVGLAYCGAVMFGASARRGVCLQWIHAVPRVAGENLARVAVGKHNAVGHLLARIMNDCLLLPILIRSEWRSLAQHIRSGGGGYAVRDWRGKWLLDVERMTSPSACGNVIN